MRSNGPYIALHLRYEKDMLAFSGCTHDLSPDEADELRMIRFEMLIVVFLNNQLIFMNPFVERPFFLDANAFYLLILFLTWRENTAHWKIKEIDSSEQRAKGYCPLTPKEVGIFLSALGYPSNTYIHCCWRDIWGWFAYGWSAIPLSHIKEQGMNLHSHAWFPHIEEKCECPVLKRTM
jgi:hypothetical protein